MVVGAVFTGLFASVAAPVLGLLLFGSVTTNGVVGLFAGPIVALGFGIYLAAREPTKRFGVAFLIAFVVGFILLAGVCVGVLSGYES